LILSLGQTVIVAALPNQRAVGLVILITALLIWAVYVVLENRRSAQQNVESFLDAPNRKNPPDDEVFEGIRLDRWLGWALISMTVVAMSLPLYWLNEQNRQTGAIKGFDNRSLKRGEEVFGPDTHVGFNCARCHGAKGGGGVAKYLVADYDEQGNPKIDPKTQKPMSHQVVWTAPRINNIGLRYQPQQIRNVLVYGRGGAKNNPMPAWGIKGGGPGDDQQIDDLVNYLLEMSIEENPAAKKAYEAEWETSRDSRKAIAAAVAASKEEAQADSTKTYKSAVEAARKAVASEAKDIAAAEKVLAEAALKKADKPLAFADAEAALASVKKSVEDAKAVLELSEGALLFNQNCARCHTSGYSYGEPKAPGGGHYGPSLRAGSLAQQFPEKKDQIAFITNGVPDAAAYGKGGVNHWSGGGMPYFGNILTPEQIEKIVDYERSLK
jgi:mono/diheme cytochrome c family protein